MNENIRKEREATTWIEEITHLKVEPDFFNGLKNGVILCSLMNTIFPGVIPKFTTTPNHLEQKVKIYMVNKVTRLEKLYEKIYRYLPKSFSNYTCNITLFLLIFSSHNINVI